MSHGAPDIDPHIVPATGTLHLLHLPKPLDRDSRTTRVCFTCWFLTPLLGRTGRKQPIQSPKLAPSLCTCNGNHGALGLNLKTVSIAGKTNHPAGKDPPRGILLHTETDEGPTVRKHGATWMQRSLLHRACICKGKPAISQATHRCRLGHWGPRWAR